MLLPIEQGRVGLFRVVAAAEGRKQYLLTRMKEKQTFVTSCDDTDFLKTDGEVYRMDGGVLNRV